MRRAACVVVIGASVLTVVACGGKAQSPTARAGSPATAASSTIDASTAAFRHALEAGTRALAGDGPRYRQACKNYQLFGTGKAKCAGLASVDEQHVVAFIHTMQGATTPPAEAADAALLMRQLRHSDALDAALVKAIDSHAPTGTISHDIASLFAYRATLRPVVERMDPTVNVAWMCDC